MMKKKLDFSILTGTKYVANNENIIYNTFDKYVVLYNKSKKNFALATFTSSIIIQAQNLYYFDEQYIFADNKLYVIENGEINTKLEDIRYTINIGLDKDYLSRLLNESISHKNSNFSNLESVYDKYLIK